MKKSYITSDPDVSRKLNIFLKLSTKLCIFKGKKPKQIIIIGLSFYTVLIEQWCERL